VPIEEPRDQVANELDPFVRQDKSLSIFRKSVTVV
jgi:hypothetical protein